VSELSIGKYIKKASRYLYPEPHDATRASLLQPLRIRHVPRDIIHKLLIKTKMARLNGTIYKYFNQLAKTELLILENFGLSHLEKQQQIDLMEIIEDRHDRYATIIASQLPVVSWYDIIGEETISDVILDRLVHTSHRIELKGESLRKK